MAITEKQLKNAMNSLVAELHKSTASNATVNKKQVIAKAVQLGMKYQEEKIRAGIEIVFNSLHEQK